MEGAGGAGGAGGAVDQKLIITSGLLFIFVSAVASLGKGSIKKMGWGIFHTD